MNRSLGGCDLGDAVALLGGDALLLHGGVSGGGLVVGGGALGGGLVVGGGVVMVVEGGLLVVGWRGLRYETFIGGIAILDEHYPGENGALLSAVQTL